MVVPKRVARILRERSWFPIDPAQSLVRSQMLRSAHQLVRIVASHWAAAGPDSRHLQTAKNEIFSQDPYQGYGCYPHLHDFCLKRFAYLHNWASNWQLANMGVSNVPSEFTVHFVQILKITRVKKHSESIMYYKNELIWWRDKVPA